MRACLRDEVGGFVAAFYCHDSGTFIAPETEACGFIQSPCVDIALMGFNTVIFEMDCKIVVDDVRNSKPNRFEYGSPLIHSCRTLLRSYVVIFSRLQANGSAYALARATLSHR
jgi:hypothetical protein